MKTVISILAIGVFLVLAGLVYFGSIQSSDSQSRFKWKILTEAEPMFVHAGGYKHMFFFDKENGIALAGLSIEKTVDGGKNWSSLKNWPEMSFYGLAFTDNQNGWIVGKEKEKPLVLKTTNKGLHWEDWQKINLDEESLSTLNEKISYFLDICFDQTGKSWIVGKGGIVEAAVDRQSLKVSGIFPTVETLYSVSCNNAGEVWAVGQDAVFQYRNGWTRKKMGNNYRFAKVISKGNDVWLLGGDSSRLLDKSLEAGVLLTSRDNGRTWEDKTPKSASFLYDLNLKDGKGWLVGAEGNIYYSTDNGNSWASSKSPTKNNLMSIFFLDSRNGWISGDRVTVLKYEN